MKSKHLFNLIKSLDASEKRYYQIREGIYKKKGGSLSQRLFQLIENQRHYDESALIRALYDKKENRQFHVLKNHLYHQVLNTLIAFQGESKGIDRIDALIRKSQILQAKKLYVEASRFLRRAAKLAEQHDQFERLLLIYKKWKILYAWTLEVDKRAEHIARFWKKEQVILKKLANLRELEWASMRVFDLYYRVHYARNQEEKKNYAQLMLHPLLKDEKAALSFSAKVIFLNTHGLYEDAIGNQEKCIEFRAQLVAHYQTKPTILQENFAQFLAIFNNFLLGLIHSSRYPEAKEALKKLGALPKQLSRGMIAAEKVMWFRAFYSLHLEVFIRTGAFSDALTLIKPTLGQFEQLDKELNSAFRYPFQYFFAYTHFALQQYEKALDFLTPLLHQVELMFKQELFRFARLLQLIIHFERGDLELLPSLIRSTRRYLLKLGGTYRLEDLILKFLNKAPYTNSVKAFRNLKKDLLARQSEILLPHVLHHFHFIAWVQSHLDKRPFSETYLEFVNSGLQA